jgi:4-hydroxybenzoate polyprenyltransferase
MIQKLGLLIAQGRPQLLPVSMSVPLAGALIQGAILSGFEVIILLFIGACAHLAGFIINDLMDFQLDRTVSIRQNSPLIRGEISVKMAKGFALLQFPLAIFGYVILLQGTSIGLLTLITSIACSFIYNRWSKWGQIPRIIPEVALALSIALLCMTGAFSVSTNVEPMQILFFAVIGLVLLFVNSIPSGIKDINTDADYGANSFVLSTGSYAEDDGTLFLSQKLRLYTIGLQGLITSGILILIVRHRLHGWMALLIIVLLVYAWLHIRQMLTTNTLAQFKRNIPFLGGFYNYFAIYLIVWTGLPNIVKIIFVLSLLLIFSPPITRTIALWRRRYVSILDK